MRGSIATWLLVAAAAAALGAGAWYYAASRPISGNAQWYAHASETDPIFAVDGTDPALLRTAINDFFAQTDDMAQTYDGTSAQKDAIRTSLYPQHFLALLPDLQAARDALLGNPSPQTATAYHNLLLRTIAAYAQDAQTLSRTLGALGTTSRVAFVAGITNGPFLAEQMSEASYAAQIQADKESARFGCYRAYNASCSASAPALRAEASTQAPSAAVDAIDGFVHDIISYAYPDARDFSPVLAVATDCFPYPTTFSRGFSFTLPTGTARTSYILNDAFFYNLSQYASSTDDTLDQGAYAAGIRFEYQNVANAYMCPDIGPYYANLSRELSMLSLAQASTSPAAARLRGLPYITLADAAAYAQAAGDPATLNLYREGSWRFDQTIQSLIKENYYVLAAEHAHSAMQFSYLITARNYASVFFLFGNPTFLAGRPTLFSGTTSTPINAGLSSWNTKLSTGMSTSSITAEAKREIDYISAIQNR